MAEQLHSGADVKYVLLFGHSFIKRLGQFMENDNVCFNIPCVNVYLKGYGGLKLKDDSHGRLHKNDARFSRSDIVVLDIGSNDLCDPFYDPATFVRDYISYAQYLHFGLDVQCVVLCQLLPRKTVPDQGYNDRVVHVNLLLEQELSRLSQVHFWKHRAGLWNASEDIYTPDGVHLSVSSGIPRYLRSLRDCVLRHLRW